ncbi:MAG: hypothetical protein JRI36_08345 [Deltaproteobacteria bacterium]|nr:hypothetical protein [Deltaproteobacteria bacterium]
MNEKKRQPNKLERLMMAVTFAEANEHDTALEMLEGGSAKRVQKRIRRTNTQRNDQRPVLRA